MSENLIERQREKIIQARSEGLGATLGAYVKMTGPGWLQSAITLGGGSLAGSLYLGIIGGYEMMWLQPLMMIFGIVMLCAISHVTLSTGERPLRSLNVHVSPVLGWGWVIATLMANLVWAMPQFSLGTAALRQNLGLLPQENGDVIAAIILAVVSGVVVLMYDKGGLGLKLFDILLKLMVASVVVSFFSVVYLMSTSTAGLPWGEIFSGFVPKPSLLFEPASSLSSLAASSSAPDYWRELIVSAQRDRMVAAAATAVGINMTFLLPYSMMKRGWDQDFRGLAKFDLSTGLFIPFLLATSCVVIAAASQFHGRPELGLVEVHDTAAAASDTDPNSAADGETVREELPQKLIDDYEANLTSMLEATGSDAEFKDLPEADRILAATMIQRDAFALANSLENLAGKGKAQIVFGIGVVGMAISTIIILMLINGFAICEMLDQPSTGWLYRIGCLLPGLTGAWGALYLWSGKAKFYLAVPTSRFGMVLLPIAYIAFFCLMNNRRLLGEAMPKGFSRLVWNSLMGIGVGLALIGAAVSILNDKAAIPGTEVQVRHVAIGLVAALVVLGFALRSSGGDEA